MLAATTSHIHTQHTSIPSISSGSKDIKKLCGLLLAFRPLFSAYCRKKIVKLWKAIIFCASSSLRRAVAFNTHAHIHTHMHITHCWWLLSPAKLVQPENALFYSKHQRWCAYNERKRLPAAAQWAMAYLWCTITCTHLLYYTYII